MTRPQRGNAAAGTDLKPPPRTWLNRLRRERGISQRQLAAATGIGQRTLSRLECGEVANPPLRYLVNCAVALGLDDWRELVEDDWEQWLPLTNSTAAPRVLTR